ncbi:MAG: type ISP restriction/modification enzyme, partial [candidate division WOR-3 bacterium]
EDLLKRYIKKNIKKNFDVASFPKKTEAGNPDFRIIDIDNYRIIGYIEAKKPEMDLRKIEDSQQINKYKNTFPNFILTNFLEFWLYRNGNKIEEVSIARPFIFHKLKTIPPIENEKKFYELLDKFFSYSYSKISQAKDLAIELAKRTQFLKEIIIEAKEEKNIKDFYEGFKNLLIKDLAFENFADLYSQTITYGLFAARLHSKNSFNRKLAYDLIPKTIGILRDLFYIISYDPPKEMEWILDDISAILANCDVKEILEEYFKKHKGEDPILHFYETFLAEYNPEEREKRGVYYTPLPVVKYIVFSLNKILKNNFKKEEGFGNKEVTCLDPAAGTLTFIVEAIKLAIEEIDKKYGKGAIKEFIKEHILKNFFAFELMVAPYAIGHLKVSYLLEEYGYQFKEDERFQFYLTNTLDMKNANQKPIPLIASLSEESEKANKIKKEEKILVILGNPPYSGISANMEPEMIDFVKKDIDDCQSYYKVDGKPLKEKKVWLQDDYVKFIRFGQWKINKNGEGILGFITNHSYLDNPTFRGMRQSLMKTFNEIYILNLHGSALKKEKAPDGSIDENVFDIRQGVAIGIFIKYKNKKGCDVYYSEVWGERKEKYEYLLKNDIETTKWKKLKPKSPFYFFIPIKEKGKENYKKYWKINDIFPIYVTGIITARDHLVIDFDKERLKSKILTFINKNLTDEFVKRSLNLKENYMWRISQARKELEKEENLEKFFTKILYRPFDIRYIFYHDAVVWRTRKEIMKHMMRENLGLLLAKRFFTGEYNYVFVDNIIADGHVLSGQQGITYLFPLYLYNEKKRNNPGKNMVMVFEEEENYETRKPNISNKLIEILKKEYKKKIAPEEIFYYIYAILYSNIYRERYKEFLKVDFPKIPFTKDYKLFSNLAELGKRLVDLHLLKSEELSQITTKFPIEGNNKIEKVSYKDNKIYINKTQYFDNIKEEVFGYYIGGYQVAKKWLEDRKNRILNLEEIKEYSKILTAIEKTIETQKEIDKIYDDIETSIINFPLT